MSADSISYQLAVLMQDQFEAMSAVHRRMNQTHGDAMPAEVKTLQVAVRRLSTLQKLEELTGGVR